jgi:hypothetical protein
MLHIDIPSHDDIRWLSSYRGQGCVSIYLPTSPVTPETEADRILLKNLVRDGVERLRAAGSSRGDIEAFEEVMDNLDVDVPYWAYQANSLALFVAPDHLVTFRLPNKLEPVVETGDRFYLKPLLRSVTVPQSAFVLALAQGGVRLVEVSNDLPPYDASVADLPTDLESAVPETPLADRMPRGSEDGRMPSKIRMQQYARKVDQALRGFLPRGDTPLILAATRPLDSIYRSVNSYPHLLEQGFRGNPEQISEADLAAQTRTVLDELFAGKMAELHDRFAIREERALATTDIAQAARAATFGAISTVMSTSMRSCLARSTRRPAPSSTQRMAMPVRMASSTKSRAAPWRPVPRCLRSVPMTCRAAPKWRRSCGSLSSRAAC